MTRLALVLDGLFRSKVRFALLLFTIAMAFVVYGVVASFGAAVNAPVSLAGTDRLVVANRMSITQPLPYAYVDRIARVEGVAAAAPAMWFGGYVREPRNEVAVIAVDPAAWLALYPEIRVSPDERAAFLHDRTGILVGERMAQRMGWRLGDRAPLRSNFWTRADGGDAWPVTVRGIFTGADARTNTDRAYMHYAYLDEGRAFLRDTIQQITLRTTSQSMNEAVAAAIDAMTRNSSYETRTADESSVRRAMLRQVGDLNAILTAVMGAAFLSILLIVANTMIMAVRQRTKEFAVLRTLGFTRTQLLRQVLAEVAMLVLLGGVLGVAAAAACVAALREPLRAAAPTLAFSSPVALGALGYAAALCALTGLAPAFLASRVRLVDALGRS